MEILPLLDIAVGSTCNLTLRKLYVTKCESFSNFSAVASCIVNTSVAAPIVLGSPPGYERCVLYHCL